MPEQSHDLPEDPGTSAHDDGWTHTNLAHKERIDRVCRFAFPCAYLLALLVLGLSNRVIG